jgi:hypothetical protein
VYSFYPTGLQPIQNQVQKVQLYSWNLLDNTITDIFSYMWTYASTPIPNYYQTVYNPYYAPYTNQFFQYYGLPITSPTQQKDFMETINGGTSFISNYTSPPPRAYCDAFCSTMAYRTFIMASSGATQCEIREITFNSAWTVIPRFTLPFGRIVSGGIIKTTNNKLIVMTSNATNTQRWLSQYSYIYYNYGALEVEIDITSYLNNPKGIFVLNGGLYICDKSGMVYNVSLNSPYNITSYYNINREINGIAQQPTAWNVSLIP